VSSEVATALGSAFVASILTTIGSRWIAGFQANKSGHQEQLRRDHEREQGRLGDERSLRDAKRERLRADYVAVTFAADNFLSASKQLIVLWAGDTPEDRRGRIEKQLNDATEDLGRATIRLKLEEGTQSIIDAYERVRSLSFASSSTNPKRPTGSTITAWLQRRFRKWMLKSPGSSRPPRPTCGSSGSQSDDSLWG
jgi:hypothetical protein